MRWSNPSRGRLPVPRTYLTEDRQAGNWRRRKAHPSCFPSVLVRKEAEHMKVRMDDDHHRQARSTDAETESRPSRISRDDCIKIVER